MIYDFILDFITVVPVQPDIACPIFDVDGSTRISMYKTGRLKMDKYGQNRLFVLLDIIITVYIDKHVQL